MESQQARKGPGGWKGPEGHSLSASGEGCRRPGPARAATPGLPTQLPVATYGSAITVMGQVSANVRGTAASSGGRSFILPGAQHGGLEGRADQAVSFRRREDHCVVDLH